VWVTITNTENPEAEIRWNMKEGMNVNKMVEVRDDEGAK
jgi:hypothetical protein